ncbi:NADPH dehydrogenase NamA [Edaphobacillus lindanitolerans]|uniref:NADPH dehydrogenase n=1 Tax=Edaphobacillus lindanitolerans TaxID=550447 RepID=A0A1U7PM60_9BACI|nr:NADPH dehydrogenase NamA [Edaphobacillus lindanitolerans]SIT81360.1 NADPH2 dehydrogenase [Edaphobacillus lindanitolerans]
MSKLFEPIEIKGVTLRNRIVMSPMCMYSCPEQDGRVQDWHLVHYPSRAVGGAGLIIVEATAVQPEGRISNEDLGIWEDGHTDGLRRLTELVKSHGAAAGIQLAHAGRKSETDGDIFAPSAIAFSDRYKQPNEMTADDIRETVSAFREAARRAKEAGFDVIELHGAHGYLLNEFLSPLSNLREDEYGGSAENRYRIVRETIDAVKEVWDGPLFVRISASDWTEGGMKPDDYVPMVQWMKEQGVDLIDVSSGAVVQARIESYPGYQVPFSETIRTGAGILTGAVGMITEPEHAEEIVQNGRADLVLLGRELLRDPFWPRRAAEKLGAELDTPVQYERGWK